MATVAETEVLQIGWKPKLDTAPLHLQVMHHLETCINDGKFPKGSLLPTENQLATALSVSRQTVRQAIATLRDQGRLSARKGVGTRVEAAPDADGKRFIGHARSELFEVTAGTELHISQREEIAARGRLAVELGCRAGRKFLHLEGIRYLSAGNAVFSWNEVYLDARLAPAVRDVTVAKYPIFHFIEAYTGEKIQEIQQDIKPLQLSAEIAQKIGCQPGDLALQITRRYFGTGRRLIEYAFQILPAARFTYTTTLRASD